MAEFVGTSDEDYIFGTDGADVVNTNGGDDIVYTFDGNDTIGVGTSLGGLYYGGKGDDVYIVFAWPPVSYPVPFELRERPGEGTDTLRAIGLMTGWLPANIENLENYNDLGNMTLNGNHLGNVITSYYFSATVFGHGGNDAIVGGFWTAGTFHGDEGNDTMSGGPMGDAFYGGAGSDTVSYFNARGAVRADLAAPRTNTGFASQDKYHSIENLTGSASSDTLIGNALANTIRGGNGADTVNGRAGADTMVGGNGNDIYHADQSGDVVREHSSNRAAGGNDLVWFSGAGGFTLSANVERLHLGGTGAANGTGNGLANTLIGNSAGNVLAGRAGSDILSGGGGVDYFVLDTRPGSGNVDRITDMSTTDFIQLKRAVFSAIGAALSAEELVATTTAKAAEADDRLIYDTDTGRLFYDSDGSGAGSAVLIARLPGGLALTATDFQMIA